MGTIAMWEKPAVGTIPWRHYPNLNRLSVEASTESAQLVLAPASCECRHGWNENLGANIHVNGYESTPSAFKQHEEQRQVPPM
eukprot:s5621_g4.t1